MINLLLESVALPFSPLNRIRNSVTRYMAETSMRGTALRSACSAEQRNNLHLLADQTLAFGVPGDLVEVGCHAGRMARVIASVIDHHRIGRSLHVFDDFRDDGTGDVPIRARLERDFRRAGLPRPVIHEGDPDMTLRTQLPERIAFAHVDCGLGDLDEHHCQRMLRCMEAIYPRMAPGAIGVLMDYHDPDRTVVGMDRRPGVKMACDHFFRSKPECIQLLYGGRFSHAFFRKVW